MAENVTLEFLGAQMERMFGRLDALQAGQEAIREDIRVLTAIVMRHDASLSAIIEQLRGMTAQFNRFNDRLRRLEEQPAK
jgi:hypothetical protein